jgi:hypothetical protein
MELRNQYVLGYTPTNSEEDGKYRRVKVTVPTPLRSHFRHGYYASNGSPE